MQSTRPQWAVGLARVVDVSGATVTVECPHCGDQHQHGRSTLGSRAVAAGCHTGFSRLREYRIPAPETHRGGFSPRTKASA